MCELAELRDFSKLIPADSTQFKLVFMYEILACNLNLKYLQKFERDLYTAGLPLSQTFDKERKYHFCVQLQGKILNTRIDSKIDCLCLEISIPLTVLLNSAELCTRTWFWFQP